jgi:hypothetical protein
LGLGTCNYIHMCINAVANSVMLCYDMISSSSSSCEVLCVVPVLYPAKWSWSCHLFLGCPTLLLPFGLYFSACLGILSIQHDFYNRIFKIKHKLYTFSRSAPPPPRSETFWVRTWLKSLPSTVYMQTLYKGKKRCKQCFGEERWKTTSGSPRHIWKILDCIFKT